MILVTGDTHGDFTRLDSKNTRDILTYGDYVIVAGDFGLCWAEDATFEFDKIFFSQKEFTTLFIDGNHENFNMLDKYEVEQWNGGKVHKIVGDKVIHLMRGQVYTIDGIDIFTFGGAQSHDIQGGLLDRNDPYFKLKIIEANENWLPYRVINESWWEQEMPNEDEFAEGIRSLEAHNWQVDYVITHSLPTSRLGDLTTVLRGSFKSDKLTDYLERLDCKLSYMKWYTGHYHIDYMLDKNHVAISNDMIELR